MFREISIPVYLQELLGRRTSVWVLSLVLAFALAATAVIGQLVFREQPDMAVWQRATLLLLIFDIAGGVVANLTQSTNAYYRESRKRRLVFLAIHVQPLLLAVLTD